MMSSLPHFIFFVLSLFAFSITSFAEGKKPSGQSRSAMHDRYLKAAIPEIEKYNLNLNDYRVSFVELHKTVTVLFVDKASSKGNQRGSTGKLSTFEVDLDPKSLKVIRSHFAR